jgi:hypothetical protein
LDQRGVLPLAGRDPAILADLFLAMLAGDLHLAALFGRPKPQSVIVATIAAAIDLVIGDA